MSHMHTYTVLFFHYSLIILDISKFIYVLADTIMLKIEAEDFG